jgi:hypothetical protein
MLIENISLQDEVLGQSIETSTKESSDPVKAEFDAALQAIQEKIDQGKKEEALDLVNQELKALDEKYSGCYLFLDLANFKAALSAFQTQLSN